MTDSQGLKPSALYFFTASLPGQPSFDFSGLAHCLFLHQSELRLRRAAETAALPGALPSLRLPPLNRSKPTVRPVRHIVLVSQVYRPRR
jgi:hypothetical protein